MQVQIVHVEYKYIHYPKPQAAAVAFFVASWLLLVFCWLLNGGSQFCVLVANPFMETPPMGISIPFAGGFNGGPHFCILVAHPFVETPPIGTITPFPGGFNGGRNFAFRGDPPWVQLCPFLEASMGDANLHFSSKSFQWRPPSMGGHNFWF